MSQRPMDGEGDWGDPVPGDQPPPPGPVPGRPYPPPGQPAYSQPHGGSGAPPPHPGQGPQKVDNFLVPSILATIFCCLPTGIAAIVFAAQVNTKVAQGDYAGAQASAAKARTWTWVSVGLGLAFGVLYFLAVVSQSGV